MTEYYYHGQTVDGRRFTLAGAVSESELVIGISLCSSKDNFSKKKGRDKAYGRVLKRGDDGKIVVEGSDLPDFLDQAKKIEKLHSEDIKYVFNL